MKLKLNKQSFTQPPLFFISLLFQRLHMFNKTLKQIQSGRSILRSLSVNQDSYREIMSKKQKGGKNRKRGR